VIPLPRRAVDPVETSAVFAPTIQAPALARRWARPHLGAWGVQGPSSDVLLVLTELVANVVRHGRGSARVRLVCHGPVLRLEVGDDDTTAVQAPHPVAPGHPCGRGLWLVDNLADRWGVDYAATGKVVWAELHHFPQASPRWRPAPGPVVAGPAGSQRPERSGGANEPDGARVDECGGAQRG